MSRELSDEAVSMLTELVKALGGNAMHINVPMVCDHCKGDDGEVFPYGLVDAQGQEWQHLCNECFDKLLPDSSYEHVEDGQIVN